MEKFNNLYPVQKTVRFELKPIGKTKENIEKGGLLLEDEERANNYKIVKGIIDEYHKQFIKSRLWDFKLPLEKDGELNSLEEYLELYNVTRRDTKQDASFKKIQDNLRAKIVKQLKENEAYERLFKKELIREDLLVFIKDDEQKDIVRQFYDFTTYFTGFHKNRENMYSSEAISTAIAFRLIHQNLPKFIENMKVFKKVSETAVSEHFSEIYSGWEEYLNIGSLEELFSLDNFSNTLTQESIEVYNGIIGKRVEKGTEIKGINEYINLYNQQQKDKSKKLPLMVPLYKQILSDREKLSWLPEEFESDSTMQTAIVKAYELLKNSLMGADDNSLKSILLRINEFDLSRIYIANGLALTNISQQMFGRYDVFTNGIKDLIRINLQRKKKETDEQFEERVQKSFKSYGSFSIQDLNNLPQPYSDDNVVKKVEDYFKGMGAINSEDVQKENLLQQLENAYIDVLPLLTRDYKSNTLSQDKTAVSKIKRFLDIFKDLQHFIKPLLGSAEETDKDEQFYGLFQNIWDDFDTITPLYNKVRNWLTRKPYSTEKIKLNFRNPQLLKGWPDIQAYSSVIFKENEKVFYLGILNPNYKTCLNNIVLSQISSSDDLQMMIYLQGGDMGKNIQNLMNVNAEVKKINGRRETTGPFLGQNLRLEEAKNKYLPANINLIRKKQSYLTTSSSFEKKDLETFIDFYIPLVRNYYSNYSFVFKEPADYKSFEEFTNHVNQQSYQIHFKTITKSVVSQLVDEGKLFLFQVWNKDFSEFSKGTPNLQTLYWRMIFNENNIKDVVYKLNGNAEIFYRKSSISSEHTVVHLANKAIENKNALNNKKTSCFEYDIIKDKRFTVDKFQFHVPLTINFKAQGVRNINPIVNEAIKNGEIKHVIGIDRGERHLLYLSLIDLQGRIVKQMTMNEIINEYKGSCLKTNYHDLLAKREDKRDEARRSWDTIDSIKELKEGYLSQVIHIISKMMVEYKAIVVLEDLNVGFMRGRQKIEKQVYEKFEKMLIDKLNCLVDKKKEPESIGGLLHPLQLTNKFDSFAKLGKQSGFLFYIPAWNTSKIDPVTGFVNLLDTRYESIPATRNFISKFNRIRYNKEKEWFEFRFDYNNFHKKAEGTRTNWTLCSYGSRIMTFRNKEKNNQWDNKEIIITDEFVKLFKEYRIDYSGNLKEELYQPKEADFYKRFMGLIKLTLQMRNSITNSEVDYMLSPVADEKGNFYDSRDGNQDLPDNADANGAYNIARKGLLLVQRIQQSKEEKISLAITNKEWLQYAQTKPYLCD